MSTRETWLNGWHRDGDTVFGHCAGCGRFMGAALGLSESDPVESPEWPFDEDSCPVCALRSRVLTLQDQADSPEDKLTARMAALRKAREDAS